MSGVADGIGRNRSAVKNVVVSMGNARTVSAIEVVTQYFAAVDD